MYICLKRAALLDDPFRTEFCVECWRIWMQAYYWENGLFYGWRTRLACVGDNIMTVERFEALVEKWPEKNE